MINQEYINTEGNWMKKNQLVKEGGDIEEQMDRARDVFDLMQTML